VSEGLPGDLACRELVELVTDYLEGALAPDERVAFELHLAVCDGCTAYLRQFRDTLRVAGRLTERSIPVDVQDRLLEAFRGWKRGGTLA
jgi:anti-sigma factor RsiW